MTNSEALGSIAQRVEIGLSPSQLYRTSTLRSIVLRFLDGLVTVLLTLALAIFLLWNLAFHCNFDSIGTLLPIVVLLPRFQYYFSLEHGSADYVSIDWFVLTKIPAKDSLTVLMG